MRVVSVQVGLPKAVKWRSETVRTGIFKEAVEGPVRLRTYGLEGDGQADPKYHGGIDKAVYSYAKEHYDWWTQNGRPGLTHGMFGENLTIEGLDESSVSVGDRFRIGTTLLEYTGPRVPCFKLAIRFEDPKIVKEFKDAGREGLYFKVVEEGELRAGDAVERV